MIQDLITFINNLKKRSYEIVLAIDADEVFASGDGGITKLLQNTAIVDSISNKYGIFSEPNTYKREIVLILTSTFVL